MKQTLNRHEKRNQRTAVIVMLAITVPILLIYGSFFKMAFFDEAGNFTLGNFQFLYKGMELKQTKIEPVGKALTNSIFFTVVVTVTEVVISCLSGYAISRLEFRGRKFIQYALLVLRMFPHLLLLIGVLYVLVELKLANSMLGVLLVAIAFRIPGSSFIIKNFFDGIPRDIENSTLVDGCSRLTAFFHVFLPIMKQCLIAAGVYIFMQAWNEYTLSSMFTNPQTRTIPVALNSLIGQLGVEWDMLCAGGMVAILPVCVMFFFAQKRLVEGLTAGAVKG